MENTFGVKSNSDSQFLLSRQDCLAQRIVIVDGQSGSGKTMLSPIIASFDRVELLSYIYEMEQICQLHALDKIAFDAAAVMVKLLTDLKLYNLMMSRDTNFRLSDLSSVFKDARSYRYFCRLFLKGDELVPKRIAKEQPILHVATHNLLGYCQPALKALGERLTLIEVVRHPLYMIKQQALNMKNLVNDSRYFNICFRYKDNDLPFWTRSWEELFLSSNSIEKAVYAIAYNGESAAKNKKNAEIYNVRIITIVFEQFVVNPWGFIKEIEQALDTKASALTSKMMKKQRVPRKMYGQGIDLSIYKRCGWEPPKNKDEKEELKIRRDYVKQNASKEALAVIDRLSQEYEDRYMNKNV